MEFIHLDGSEAVQRAGHQIAQVVRIHTPEETA